MPGGGDFKDFIAYVTPHIQKWEGNTMQALNNALLPGVQKINGYLSDYVLIVLLLGAGLFFSFKTKFVQVRCFGEGMKKVFGNLT